MHGLKELTWDVNGLRKNKAYRLVKWIEWMGGVALEIEKDFRWR